MTTWAWRLAHSRNTAGTSRYRSRASSSIVTANSNRLVTAGRIVHAELIGGRTTARIAGTAYPEARVRRRRTARVAVTVVAIMRAISGIPPTRCTAYAIASQSHSWFVQSRPAAV
jgi:hypothetical protein